MTRGSAPHFTKAQSPWRQILDSIVTAASAAPEGMARLFSPELGAHVDAFLVDAAAWPQSPAWLKDIIAQLRPMRRAWAMALVEDAPQRAWIATLAEKARIQAAAARGEAEHRQTGAAEADEDLAPVAALAAAPISPPKPVPVSQGQRIAAAFAKRRAQMLLGLTPATDTAKRTPKATRSL